MAYTAPRTWVAAEIVTAALLNTHLRDNFKTFSDARVAYTPNFTGWTLGNGTLTGQHVTAGKFITGSLKYVVGSTDTISGTPAFSLPASPKEDSAGPPLGIGSLFDTSTSARVHWFLMQSGTARFQFASEADTRVTATAPWTWATGDIFRAEFAYEAA